MGNPLKLSTVSTILSLRIMNGKGDTETIVTDINNSDPGRNPPSGSLSPLWHMKAASAFS
jgi:hypothetical protein